MSLVKIGDGTITHIIKPDSELVDDAVTRRALAKAKAAKQAEDDEAVTPDENKTEQQ